MRPDGGTGASVTRMLRRRQSSKSALHCEVAPSAMEYQAKGTPLEAVRTAFFEARARFGSQPLSRAWFSCSTAYSNGRDGVWNLLAR